MANVRWLIFLFSTPLFVASCASAGPRHSDSMCNAIAHFAESAKVSVTRSVTLRGGWGGDTPDLIMTHDCVHSGYEPGKQLCDYLLPNTSWEFGQYNAEVAIACLDSAERRKLIRKLEQDEWPIKVTSSMQQLKDKHILVTVSFSTSNLSVLILSATRSSSE